jgi:PAS domain S-box-containing protein
MEFFNDAMIPNNESVSGGKNNESSGEDKLRISFNSIPMGIVNFDANGIVTDYNSIGSGNIRLKREMMLGKNLLEIKDYNVHELVKAALAGKYGHYEGLLNSDVLNKYIPIRIVIGPVVFPIGEVVGGMAVIEDISESKEMQRIFFHDLLNNVGNLRNLSELVIDEDIDSKTQRRVAGLIHTQANRVLDEIQMHRHILSFGATEIKPEFLEINSIAFVKKLIVPFANSEEGVIVELGEKFEEAVFISDILLFGRAFKEMLKNAVEASKKGDTVRIECWTNNKRIFFSVHNSEPIPGKIRQSIFAKPRIESQSGHGLGAYCIKYITENYLNGSVIFATSEKEGTTFTVNLPIEQ